MWGTWAFSQFGTCRGVLEPAPCDTEEWLYGLACFCCYDQRKSRQKQLREERFFWRGGTGGWLRGLEEQTPPWWGRNGGRSVRPACHTASAIQTQKERHVWPSHPVSKPLPVIYFYEGPTSYSSHNFPREDHHLGAQHSVTQTWLESDV